MSKPPSNSLYARLTPKQRDQVLHWLIVEAKSLQWARDQIEANCGVDISLMGVSRFLSSHGLPWKMDRAKEAAELAAKAAPKDIEEKIAQGLKQREFEKVFSELTVKELVSLRRLEIAGMKLEVDRRKLALLEKRLAEAQTIVAEAKSKGGLTPETLKKIEEKLRA